MSEGEIEEIALLLPTIKLDEDRTQISLVDALLETELVTSKTEARTMIKQGAISVNGEKVTDENYMIMSLSILKRGKNKFALVR